MIFDDLIGIKAMYRLIFQSLIVFLMIMMSEEYISNVGNLLNNGDIYLGNFAIPFTIFCVVGLMNAFNMIDGCDGLAAGLAVFTIVALLYSGSSQFVLSTQTFLLMLAASISIFLLFNL